MLRLLADENIRLAVVMGLRSADPPFDVVTAQEANLVRTPDDAILAWSMREARVLLTYDMRTIPPLAWALLEAGRPVPGVIVAPADALVADVVRGVREIDAAFPDGLAGVVVRI